MLHTAPITRFLAILFVAVLLCAASFSAGHAGTICGTVRDASTDLPVSQAAVFLYDNLGAYTGIYTAADGAGGVSDLLSCPNDPGNPGGTGTNGTNGSPHRARAVWSVESGRRRIQTPGRPVHRAAVATVETVAMAPVVRVGRATACIALARLPR